MKKILYLLALFLPLLVLDVLTSTNLAFGKVAELYDWYGVEKGFYGVGFDGHVFKTQPDDVIYVFEVARKGLHIYRFDSKGKVLSTGYIIDDLVSDESCTFMFNMKDNRYTQTDK